MEFCLIVLEHIRLLQKADICHLPQLGVSGELVLAAMFFILSLIHSKRFHQVRYDWLPLTALFTKNLISSDMIGINLGPGTIVCM